MNTSKKGATNVISVRIYYAPASVFTEALFSSL